MNFKEIIKKIKQNEVFKFVTDSEYHHKNPWIRVLYLITRPIVFIIWTIGLLHIVLWVLTLGGLPFIICSIIDGVEFDVSNLYLNLLTAIYLIVDIIFIVIFISHEFKEGSNSHLKTL